MSRLCATICLLLMAVSCSTAQNSTNRPANWARPMTLPGVPNCYQVTANLCRGAQPTEEGMKQLKAMGIKTIITLREFHSDKNIVREAGLNDVRIKMAPLNASVNEVVEFLKAATNTNNVPAFVHCERGADRTGLMCAMYRVVVCGWTKEDAIAEMKNGGFGFNPAWKNLVSFIEKADVAAYKRRIGLPL